MFEFWTSVFLNSERLFRKLHADAESIISISRSVRKRCYSKITYSHSSGGRERARCWVRVDLFLDIDTESTSKSSNCFVGLLPSGCFSIMYF